MARRRDDFVADIWRERLRRFDRGGMTVSRFCDDEGVSVASFYVWRRRLRRGANRSDVPAAGQASGGPALFMPVALPAGSLAPASSSPADDVRIDLADGVVIHLPLAVEEPVLRMCLRAARDVTRSREGG